MLAGLTLDVILLQLSKILSSGSAAVLTAIGLDNVRTARDVNLRASDMLL